MNQEPPIKRKPIGKIVGINIGLVLMYTFILMARFPGTHRDSLSFALMMMLVVAQHALACLVAGIVFWVRGQKEYTAPFILAALAVALIGFSACLGGAEFMTSGRF